MPVPPVCKCGLPFRSVNRWECDRCEKPVDQLRRDLAAKEAECERLRGACEAVLRHMKQDYWRQAGGYQQDADRLIARIRLALAAPAADAGEAIPPKPAPLQPETTTKHPYPWGPADDAKRGSIVAGMEALRQAGGKAWDGMADVEAFLGRTPAADAGEATCPCRPRHYTPDELGHDLGELERQIQREGGPP